MLWAQNVFFRLETEIMSSNKDLVGKNLSRKRREFEATMLSSSQFPTAAEPIDVLQPNGDDQGNIMMAAEHEMIVSWMEEVGLLRKTRKGLTG